MEPVTFYPDGYVPSGNEIDNTPTGTLPVNTFNGDQLPTVQSMLDNGPLN